MAACRGSSTFLLVSAMASPSLPFAAREQQLVHTLVLGASAFNSCLLDSC